MVIHAVPPAASYCPDPRFPTLGSSFYDVVAPARFPSLTLRYRNLRWAERVGLGSLSERQWLAAFARFEPLPDNLPAPLALRYHGHQFRTYNAQLGDGRGFLFAQLRDAEGRLLDLATKGSGKTPWSRGGDGRLTLKGGVRELLATELLEALGVPTSKTFSLFETGEWLSRNDEPSPTRASVLVRLSHSHIRFGSFQRLAYLRDLPGLRALVDFTLALYAPELCHPGEQGAELLLRWTAIRSAELCAAWMAAGFVHGVLNTDNLNITGESFDYGPYRFLPTLDVGFTAAYFDHSGLYAYGRQPEAVRWNLVELARALLPLVQTGEAGYPQTALDLFDEVYQSALDAQTIRRLGLASDGGLADRLLRASVWQFLQESQVGFERFFFDWYGGRGAVQRGRPFRSPEAAAYRTNSAVYLLEALAARPPHRAAKLDHEYFHKEAPCTLLIEELERIWDAIASGDDWTPLERKLGEIAQMRDALEPQNALTEPDDQV